MEAVIALVGGHASLVDLAAFRAGVLPLILLPMSVRGLNLQGSRGIHAFYCIFFHVETVTGANSVLILVL